VAIDFRGRLIGVEEITARRETLAGSEKFVRATEARHVP
jgi:hypothetical protein